MHPNPINYYFANDDGYSIVGSLSGPASSIYPSLKIPDGEAKITIECGIFTSDGMKLSSTGLSTKNISKSKLFGFLFYTPTATKPPYIFFSTVLAFTPKPGLFDETPPQ